MRICCIIKPPALVHERHIIRLMAQEGLGIITAKEVMYSAELVDVLYDHMDAKVRARIAIRYGGRVGKVLLTTAPSIAACMHIIGTESDPRACAARSVRARFGESAEPEWFGAWSWWENAVHRPVDERERLRDLYLLFPEYMPLRAESAG